MAGQALPIGPFLGGLNTFSDATSIADNELSICENFDLDIDGSLKSRPAFIDNSISFPLNILGGNIVVLGYYVFSGVNYLLASDGYSSTYYFNGTSWVLVTNTFAASSMTQFDNKAWMTAPVGSTNPGGYWTPGGGFVAVTDMPKGDVIISHKFRLWIIKGMEATSEGTRLYHSATLGTSPFWPTTTDFIDIGSGDGQNIVSVLVYYNNILILRTHSIYSLQYTTDPAAGIVSLLVPGIGVAHKEAMVLYENYLYFMYDDRAYEFSNSRSSQINIKVPFSANSRTGIYQPYSVSVFNQRVIFSFFDRLYIFGLKTRTWTIWKTSFGAMGKFISSPAVAENESAIAHGSTTVPVGTVFTNLVQNPQLMTGSTDWAGGAGAGGAGTAARALLSLTVSYYMQVTVTTAPTGSGPGVYNFAVGKSPVVPGSSYYARINGFVSWAGALTLCRVYFYSAGAVIVGSMTGVTAPHTAGSAEWREVLGVAPPGAAYARVDFLCVGGTLPGVGDRVAASAAFVEQTDAADNYFDGSVPDTADFTFDWTGTAHASTSTKIAKRLAPTLFITDAFTEDIEEMVCILETKNFNYEASSIYKRLFSWGVDAIFKGIVTATAIPISFNYNVTWGELRSAGVTWGSRFDGGFTWGQPTTDGLSVITTVDTSGVSKGRKFVKLGRSLRFRQIRFRLSFSTNGSSSQAPVRVFGLMTYVSGKAKVTKQIT